MSCFIDSIDNVKTIASAVAIAEKWPLQLDPETLGSRAVEIAQTLHNENVRGWNANYRSDDKPEKISAVFVPAEFNPVEVACLARCLNYQSCDSDDYATTDAAQILAKITLFCVAPEKWDQLNTSRPLASLETLEGLQDLAALGTLPDLTGAPLEDGRGNTGYIIKRLDDAPGRSILGFGADGIQRLSPIQYRAIYVNGGWVEDNTAKTWTSNYHLNELTQRLEKARQYNQPAITAAQARRLEERNTEELRQAHEKATQQREEWRAREAEFLKEVEQRRPTWAKAAIIASLHVNESDGQSDYYGHSTEKTLILGWSKHTRNLFPELRKAALNAAETEDLATAPDTAEHRENYSGGGGHYLAKDWNHASGWNVSKVPLGYGKDFTPDPSRVPVGEWRIPEDQPQPPKPRTRKTPPTVDNKTTPSQTGATVTLNQEKNGVEVAFASKPGEDTRNSLKAAGFRWSRKQGLWYAKQTPETLATAEAIQGDNIGQTEPALTGQQDPSAPALTGQQDPSRAEKLRTLAEKLQPKIDHAFSARLENTPKRVGQAAHARLEGQKLERAQLALNRLADEHQAGTLPQVLQGVTSKKRVLELLATKTELVANGFHTYSTDTGEPVYHSAEAGALWDLIAKDQPTPDSRKDEQELQRELNNVKFAQIPGYFSTPKAVLDELLAHVSLFPGCKVLEPEAGSGAICDAVREREPGAEITAFEVNHSLCNILELKGYEVTQGDFLQDTEAGGFDYVIQNPPFERQADIDHIRHAFDKLQPGGRLVSVCSPGPFFRDNTKSVEFRQWIESLGGEKFDLPDGSFKESGTSINTVYVVIDKPQLH